jgi:hypothetical protein
MLMTHVYFPTTRSSLLRDGRRRVGRDCVVGNAGIVRVSLFMGGNRPVDRSCKALKRFRMRAAAQGLQPPGPVLHLLLRYARP